MNTSGISDKELNTLMAHMIEREEIETEARSLQNSVIKQVSDMIKSQSKRWYGFLAEQTTSITPHKFNFMLGVKHGTADSIAIARCFVDKFFETFEKREGKIFSESYANVSRVSLAIHEIDEHKVITFTLEIELSVLTILTERD